MTARDLIVCMVRRWYVTLAGAGLALGALYVVASQPPVYETQFNILLVGPSGQGRPSVLDHPLYGLQGLAGVLATEFNAGHPPLLTGDVDATMVGTGDREGVQVRVPNLGTQWRPAFPANYLDVQVAGSTADEVSTAAAIATQEVAHLLDTRQDDLGVPPALRARAVPSSADPPVYPVQGSRSRAGAATLAAGGALTVGVVYWLEWWHPRRRRPTSPPERGAAWNR